MMGKNIVVCLDGTGNQFKARGNTNVVKLYEMLDLRDPTAQIAYYDPGVGTFSAAGAWSLPARKLSKLFGLAFGSGLKANLAEAYTYLMHHYEPGDRIHLFGFSRGAYTARALAGLLKSVGLLRPGSENLVPYAIGVYAKNRTFSKDDWKQLHQFADAFSRKVDERTGVPVHFMGLWDSVKAAGLLRWNLRWLYTRRISNVDRVRHAVSIDEKRRPYEEYLVLPPEEPGAPGPLIEEVWFAGVHSDVGGTFEGDEPKQPGTEPAKLSTVTLKWVVDGALDSGLLLKDGAYAKHVTLSPAHAEGRVHRMGRVWALLTYRRRRVPDGARVHETVRLRIESDAAYGKRIPAGVGWADKEWLSPHPGAR
ncbi:T6SS phospholipase effector Tle1-like catalytic domain-containing protein [Streptomyces alboflavus]|uniref:T6SS phospholipase effector Tle1-like catalytic domain-containing protein n=1 Tax=Streptomyces alboflavus TaxID=67267 RepID=UPI0036B8460A